MLSHLQTEVGVEFEAELGNIGCFGAGLTIASPYDINGGSRAWKSNCYWKIKQFWLQKNLTDTCVLWCLQSVSLVFHGCSKGFSNMFWGCCKDVAIRWKKVSSMFQGSRGVSRQFWGCFIKFKGVSRVSLGKCIYYTRHWIPCTPFLMLTEKWIGGTVCITVQLAARLA